MNIKENIEHIKKKYLVKSEGYKCEYYSRGREDEELDYEFEMEEELETYFKEQGIQYEVKKVSGERSCSYDSDYLFVAWVSQDGKLETDFVLLESM